MMQGFDFPVRIQIQTINRCNYACRMCPYPQTAAGTRLAYFDEQLFRRLIDEVREAGRRVKLCLMLQNEPLLDRRFLDFLRYAHAAEDAVSTVSTVTNGSTLTPELLDQLCGFERLRLTISVNANDAETYRTLHRRDLWDRIHGLLVHWHGRRDRVRVSFVFDATSVAAAVRFQERWSEAGYATRLVAINARVDSLSGDSLFHSVDEDFGFCSYPLDTLTVLVDGSVILCCNDWEHRVRFGNLHQAGIAKIWNSPEFLEFRRAAVEGTLRRFEVCKGCDYPMRSSDRVRLEATVARPTLPDPLHDGGQGWLEHVSELRAADGGPALPLLVYGLDEDTATVTAFAPSPTADLPCNVLYRFPIAFSGTCSFSTLEPIWCPGRLRELPQVAGIAGFTPLRIKLDRNAPEYRFFPWYCADWRVPQHQLISQRERRSEWSPDRNQPISTSAG